MDELFLTGTTTEVLAVIAVDRKPVGNGQPGPVTKLLSATYQQAVAEWLIE
jgi:branched-subunit amino acid aminotransferase/4-amino-4-deoxychorismate lyase